MTGFGEILDAADHLPVDEQQALVEILGRRIAERSRSQLVRDAQDGRAEFAAGQARTASVKEIMDEVAGEA
ncbi:MAG TPA: hypothetical protein VGM76_02770 [Lacipirellulaceae bacterium]|jgi:hypothetical protein